MVSPQEADPLSLKDILITEELTRRGRREPDFRAENAALGSLAKTMAETPDRMLDSLVEGALELCRAGSAGVSLLETQPNGDVIFRWVALAGKLAPHLGGFTPRGWSPCGACLDRGGPILVSHPARLFTYFKNSEPQIVEGLVLPMYAQGNAVGTIWIVAHDEDCRFDLEDVRVMTAIANMAAGATHFMQQIAERKRLSLAASFQASLLDQVRNAVIATDTEGRITHWNAFAEQLYQWKADEVLGKGIEDLMVAEQSRKHAAEIMATVTRKGYWEGEFTVKRKDGTSFPAAVSDSVVRNEAGEVVGYVGISTDISDRKRMEEHIRQTQKLESIGVLAGGIAHDFNNLLVGILGNACLAQQVLGEGHPVGKMLELSIQSSHRAADLTAQMLAYAGKGRFVVKPLDVSARIRDMAELLRVSVPARIELRLELAEDLPSIEADVSQIEQVIMNLVINSGEAIGEKEQGTIWVRTGVEAISAGSLGDRPRLEGLEAGLYVFIEVQDTGCGMDDETMSRIFDPFFTTKFTGRGLGLAAAHGAVRGHRGALLARSSPDRGSTFKALLPVGRKRLPDTAEGSSEETSRLGTVLVVDDQLIVRKTAAAMLENLGYRVVAAANGREAVEKFQKISDRVVAVLLDLSMPVMSGEAAAPHLRAIREDVPIVLTSGYSESEAAQMFGAQNLQGFLKKPYTSAELREKLLAAMGKRVRRAG